MPITTAPAHPLPDTHDPVPPERRGPIGRVVAGSLGGGLFVAALSTLVLAPGSTEPVVTGLVLLSFALGWLSLWHFSRRLSDQPQAWALVPAVVMGGTGAVCLVVRPGDAALTDAGWVWPPVLFLLVVWMVSRVRRSLRGWARPVLLYPVLLALQVTAVGGLYETVQETGDVDHLAVGGHLYDVGGHRLWMSCTGSGSPTVVLESGLGEASAPMSAWIAPAVAHDTRVCVYDRAGYGRSEPRPDPSTDQATTSDDLHTLLEVAGERGPYVLAGHSTGAVYVLLFADAYPDEIAGVVLLDGQSPDVMSELPVYPTFYAGFRRVEALAPTLARFGVAHLFAGLGGSDLPEPQRGESRATWSTPAHFRVLRDEFAALPAALELAQDADSLDATPLVVVTAEKDAEDGWLPLQDALSELSTDAVHVRLADVTHTSLVEDPDDAALAAGAITALVTAVRTGHRVADGSP
jgi:pimeloyl-ACP methyl ester carboxylesterase